MRLLNLFKQSEKRSVKSSDPYLAEYFGQRDGIGNGYVNPDRASGHAVAHRCIQVIAESLASVPLNVYRHADNDGREKAKDHPLHNTLHNAMNSLLTAFEGREWLIASVAAYGNAYARIERNGRGQVIALYPLVPGNITVEKLSSGRVRYRHAKTDGGTEILLQEECLHIRYRTKDGYLGISPIQNTRETMSRALAEGDTAAAMIGNGFRFSGALTFPDSLTDDQHARIDKTYRERFSGANNSGKLLVLEGGADFKPFTMPAKDAEFLESRKLSNLDICRIFGVPPSAAGITDNATYSNIGEESRALVVRCLAPWAKRIEQAMNATLLTAESRKTLFIEHDLAGLLRGDMKARYEAYRIGREWGWLSPDEIRGWENLPKIEGGNEYLSPLNMTPLGERKEEI